jgi:hypothetical protein
VLPPAPPDQAARLDQDPPPTRHRQLDRPDRPQLDQPRPAPTTSSTVPAPPPIPTADPLEELSPREREEELWHDGLLPDDVGPFLTAEDAEPHDSDRLRHRLLHTDTRWTLDLANHYAWQDIPD